MQKRAFDPLDVCRVLGIDIPPNGYSSGNFDMKCFFCDDTKKHMNINLQLGKYHCHRCSEGGSLVQLYGKLHTPPLSNISETRDALRAEIENNGIILDKQAPKRQLAIDDNTVKTADIKIRDIAYKALLNVLPSLQREHANDLLRRGLDLDTIRKNGYKSTFQGESSRLTDLAAKVLKQSGLDSLEGVPGFFLNKNGVWSAKYMTPGYFIPFRDTDGRISGMQIRVSDSTLSQAKKNGKDLGKYIWYTSSKLYKGETKGAAGAAVVHRSLHKATDTIIITEGGLKADVASHLLNDNYLILGIAGTSSVKRLPDALNELRAKGMKRVFIAMDMDMYQNEHVMQATIKITGLAKKTGATVKMLQWNEHKGIDDFLFALLRKGEAISYRLIDPSF